jgi:hypothetical protein
MKRHIIFQFQGTIVVITVLIAVMLGMTNPSTALGAKPLPEYTDVVMVECSGITYQVDVDVFFYTVDKDGTEIVRGWAEPSCLKGHEVIEADALIPVRYKPNMWEAWLLFWDGNASQPYTYCSVGYTGTDFPATVSYTCAPEGQDPVTATVTIGNIRVFP